MTGPTVVPDSDLDYDSDLVCTLDGAAFTGIAYEESPSLGRSEITYRDGVQEGLARDWYPTGTLKGESDYVEGVLHGASKEYDPAGRLAVESRYEYGTMVWLRRFDPEGALVELQELDFDSEGGQRLQRLRIEHGWVE